MMALIRAQCSYQVMGHWLKCCSMPSEAERLLVPYVIILKSMAFMGGVFLKNILLSLMKLKEHGTKAMFMKSILLINLSRIY